MSTTVAQQIFAPYKGTPGAAWLRQPEGHLLLWEPSLVVRAEGDWRDAVRRMRRVSGEGGVLVCLPFEAQGQGVSGESSAWIARYEGGYRVDEVGVVPFGAPPKRSSNTASALAKCSLPTAVSCHSVHESSYVEAVEQVKRWLFAGDCYQINLTRAIVVPKAGSAFELFRRLLPYHAKHGAYVCFSCDHEVVCNSPETLLSGDDRQVMSLPIKGTRPRGATAAEDEALVSELLRSSKDDAELSMIVDLVRNDLGRVAALGSVKVSPKHLVRHARVSHTHQDVSAILAEECDFIDALYACFPPGSVTGAPKKRAVQRIQQLEGRERGMYCGSIGWLPDHGQAQFSVAIRTAEFHKTTATVGVGGGIVVDSIPQEEWLETKDKAATLLQHLLKEPSMSC